MDNYFLFFVFAPQKNVFEMGWLRAGDPFIKASDSRIYLNVIIR